ncbi:hypothetical protein NVP1232O_33 [Vibrio phage 1.232.O._10N.261.51.E11]|nr:hypothetical protein NVP1232O_33 [Vibrio phage 1.232.O._10N.261.51.E11]
MIKARLLLLLVPFAVPALADEANSAASAAYADGTVVNQNYQNNNTLDNELPYVTMSRDRVTCPTGKFTAAAIPTKTNSDYGDSDSASLMVGLSIPVDFNGTVDRCKQQQRLMIRNAEWEMTDREIDTDMRILAACKKAFDDKININPKAFPWAKKCDSLTFVRETQFYK